MKEVAQASLQYIQENLVVSLVIAVIAGFAGMKSVSLAKKTNPALFFFVGALGVFLGQFAILSFGLKDIVDELAAFRFFIDLLMAYIGSFIVATLVNIFSPH